MQTLLTLIEQHGLWLVLANVFALQVGLPVPAYPTLIVVGAITARSGIPPWQVIAVAVLASLVADLLWYAAGTRLGRRVLRLMCALSLSPDSCVRQSEKIYERWGPASLMVAKFVPGFAAVATSMAGVVRTPLARFVVFDSIGALLWSGVAVAIGWLFRDAVNEVLDVFAQAGRWGVGLLVTALALYIAVKAVQRYRLIRMLRMARIGVDELNAMLRRNERPLIIDVRSLATQREGCIPGAVWIDSRAIDTSIAEQGLADSLPDEVIVYCDCPNEASAALVARRLMRAGFKRVRPLAGGIEAWVEHGYDVEMNQ
ncbi:rhodanese-like domain-containing protein [Aquabacterium sp.]|uniref:rhodanese-like domain-containing protein n=1 Tax=Aquabacterium sp. TaxID=1872578 RepID=UPI002D0B2E0E|nr:rhodanese-like domain-containing protein [Aquabacterium sp.]HSW04726.1 rhodanese-like domain-containing protein [Aquabacterium sp.]